MLFACAGSRAQSRISCRALSTAASAVPQAPAPNTTSALIEESLAAPDERGADESRRAVDVAHAQPAALRGLDQLEDDVLRHAESERRPLLGARAHVGDRRRDEHHALVAE